MTNVASVAGFGLCKAATALASLTAMGSSPAAVGLVSDLDFMLAMSASSFATAVVVVARVMRGRIRPGSLSPLLANVLLVLGFLSGMARAFVSDDILAQPLWAESVLCGSLCGFAVVVLQAAWLELLALQPGRKAVVRRIACGLVVQCVLVSVVLPLGTAAVCASATAMAVASGAAFALLRRRASFPQVVRSFPTDRAQRSALLRAYACLFAMVAVVGVLHTTVLGSRVEHIVGDVSMWVPLAVSTAVAVLVAGLTVRAPDPAVVYKACLPVMLAVLSLLPFLGDRLGKLTGIVMISCYDVCGMVFLLFIVERARSLRLSCYVLTSVYAGGSGLFLTIGLEAGQALNALSAAHDLSLLTLLAFAVLYPLIAALVISLRHARPRPDRSEDVPDAEGARNVGGIAGVEGARGIRDVGGVAGVERSRNVDGVRNVGSVAGAEGAEAASSDRGDADRKNAESAGVADVVGGIERADAPGIAEASTGVVETVGVADGFGLNATAASDCAGGAGAGADGVTEDVDASRLVDAVGGVAVVSGAPMASEAFSVSESGGDALAAGVVAVAEGSGLTRREREILGYLARGRSAKYIAEELVISENTVWAHVKRIYSKTGVHSKQELMSVVERAAE